MTKTLRFCFFTSYFPPHHVGGDAVYVRRLAEALIRQGHHVDVIYSLDAFKLAGVGIADRRDVLPPELRPLPLQSGIPWAAALAIHQTGSPRPYRKQILQRLEQGDYDVLHYHNVSLLGGPGLLKLGSGIKLYTAHEYWLICPTHVLFRYNREPCTQSTCWRCTLRARRPPQLWRSGALLRQSLECVDCLLMSSRFCRDKHREQGIERPMVVLPPLVPGPNGDLSPNTSPRPYFVFAGRLEKLKGVDDLVQVFKQLPAADLRIAGDGKEDADLRRLAAGATNIHFTGIKSWKDLQELYAGAVAILGPSKCYETFGLSVAEGLYCGVPAIVREGGALSELVEDSRAGLTFSTREQLRRAIERLIADSELRRELGRMGAVFASRNWSQDVHIGRYLSLIEGLANQVDPADIEREWREST